MSGAADRIREAALELGFCAVGFARAERPEGADRFEEWLEAGMHGTMSWMADRAAERLDPSQLVPRAATVVSVAVDYHHGPAPPLPDGAGRVARYAHGRDYHNVVNSRLRKLQRLILAELPGVRVYKSVDTGPVLERSFAAAAGVASLAKSGNLIAGELGSWVLLGQIVMDRELPPDLPAPDLCGACVACLDACPTAAIVEPGLVDARRCIAYLTIEHRGPIGEELREALGGWVFGCDECQTACPITVDDRAGTDRAFAPIAGRAALDPLHLLTLDEARYHAEVHGSPLRRAGAESMRRNAALRLGNYGDRAAAPALVRALGEDPSPVVRGAGAWALGRLGGPAAKAALERRRTIEEDRRTRDEIDRALGST